MKKKEDRPQALSAEKRALAEENHNLIYKFALSHHIDLDEYYDLLAIGYCIAANIYDPNGGARFSTLAYQCMMNEFCRYLRQQSTPGRIPPEKILSFSAKLSKLDPDSELTVFDTLSDDRMQSYAFDKTEAEIHEFIKELPECYRRILIPLMDGEFAIDVAKKVGCSKQNISRARKVLEKKWEAYETNE